MICSLSFSLNTGDRPANKSVSHATSALFRLGALNCKTQASFTVNVLLNLPSNTEVASTLVGARPKELISVFLQRRPRPPFAVQYSCLDKRGPSRLCYMATRPIDLHDRAAQARQDRVSDDDTDSKTHKAWGIARTYRIWIAANCALPERTERSYAAHVRISDSHLCAIRALSHRSNHDSRWNVPKVSSLGGLYWHRRTGNALEW
jgi:hypothetical protein